MLARTEGLGNGGAGALGDGANGGKLGDLGAQIAPELGGQAKEDAYDRGIELLAGAARDLLVGRREVRPFSIGPIRGDGIQRVGDGKDAGSEGSLGRP
jgi:hypothetical protein